MRKWIVLGSVAALVIMCIGFVSASSEQRKTITSKPMPADVQEEYLIPEVKSDGTTVYKTDEFEATVVENREEPVVDDQPDSHSTIESIPLPEDVEEEYLDPVEIEDGVYEYRDSDGNLIATMHDYESAEDMEAALSVK